MAKKNWMMGTAAAALIVASPAFAQTGTELGNCQLNAMTNEEFLALDADADGSLSMDEYRLCLDQANIAPGERAEYEAAFGEADASGMAILTFADIESYRDQQQASVGDDGQPQGTITVTQPAADVTVRQPSPDVTVTQQDPTVNVQPQAPEVSVDMQAPDVDVTQADPQVAVTQPEPDVSVTQPEAEVSVSQPNPEVAVQAGQPAVSVDAAEPEVSVATSDPEVAVEQPELDVNVEQDQADVAVVQEQPEVGVRQSGSADVTTETAAVGGTETDATADATASYQIAIDEIVGRDVYNTQGEELGEVTNVLLDPTAQTPMVVIRSGGFLGLGGREVALPYDDMSIGGDQIVVNTPMTSDQLGEMPQVEEASYEALPDTMIVR